MLQQPFGGLHEHDANQVIAAWLAHVRPDWQASAERTRTIQGSSDRPDIIIQQGDRMPVIVECEYGQPAVGDAKKRLGKELVNETRSFTEVVAIGIDEKCQNDTPAEFRNRLDGSEPILQVQLVRGVDSATSTMWPSRPLSCRAEDLVAYCEYAQVPQNVIDDQSRQIAERIEASGTSLVGSIRATGILAERTLTKLRELTGCRHPHENEPNAVPPEEYPDFLSPVCPNVCDHDAQATRTACAIWLIAIDLQNDLAQYSRNLQGHNLHSTAALKNASLDVLTVSDVLTQWRIIAGVNYLPVIELAIESLGAGAMGNSIPDVLDYLHQLSGQINALHAKHVYNFAGELWQRLVTDREERAAHYTKPEIAELLSSFGAERFNSLGPDAIANLSLMDAACGTGTLLGAGERALRRKYAIKGGRDANLHRKRMEEHIYGMDINGIAGTLTAKRLTDINVEQDYAKSKVAVITDPAGSLILMNPGITGVSQVLGYRSVTPTKGIGGEEGIFHVMLQGIDWSLMNPPYSRPRKGRQQATKGLEPLRAAAKRAKYLMSHGQAGLASDFSNLSNIRLAPRGVYAHVLPLSAAHAGSWKSWRSQMEKDFQDIVAIANTSSTSLQSMSADTGMSEMLVVATKRPSRPTNWRKTRILCVNLNSAPTTMAEGYAMAQEIAAIQVNRDQGLLTHGSYSRIDQNEAGFPWTAVGNSNNELTTVSISLIANEAFDPLNLTTHKLAMTMATLGDLCSTGPTHHTIGHATGSDPGGAFEWTLIDDFENAPAQQSMWAVDATRQTTIDSKPTHGGTVTHESTAKQMVGKRSRWFLNRNIRWTSQATAVAKTSKLAHGGRGWNALQELTDSVGKCIALYYNSTFGAIVRNAYGQSTQAGRAPIQVKAIEGLPCPDFSADTQGAKKAREITDKNFDKLAKKALQPFAYCFRDKNRVLIDLVVAEMLGLDTTDESIREMLEHYRLLFASEPNVNGHNKKIVETLAEHQQST